MKKPTIMCKEMHLHDIILGLMLHLNLQLMLDIFLNQQPFHRDISILQAKALGPAIYHTFQDLLAKTQKRKTDAIFAYVTL